MIVLNDVRANATATVTKVALSGASVLVGATESAQILAEATNAITASGGSFYGPGTVLAVGGQMVTNRVVTHTTATLSASTVTATAGDVAVTADNAAGIDATLATTLNSGDQGVAVSLAFNTLGWKPSNALFNLIDAILGDPLISTAFKGEDPALAARHGHRHDAQRDRRRQGRRDQPRRAQRHGQQRRELGGRGAVQRQGHGGRRDRGLQQGLQRRPRDARRRRGHAGRRGRRHRERRGRASTPTSRSSPPR